MSTADLTPPAFGALLEPSRIVDAALAAFRGAEGLVVVTAHSRANVRWANSTVTTSGLSTGLDFYVVAIEAGAAATVFGSAFDAGSTAQVAAVVHAAQRAARVAAQRGPARDASPLAAPTPGDVSGPPFGDPPPRTSFAVFDRLLPTLAAAFERARHEERILYGFARHELSTVYLGTTRGLLRRWTQPTGSFELHAKSSDGQRTSWTGLSTPDFSDVDALALDASLAERLGWARRRIALPPGRYPTVLPPSSVADFLIYYAWSAGARPAFEGRSAFSGGSGLGGTRLGERLTRLPLNLRSHPAEPGLECVPFAHTAHSTDERSVFDGGCATEPTRLLEQGRIAGLFHTRASARQYAQPYTPAGDNLILDGGTPSLDAAALVAKVRRGLLLTSCWYLREVDPMSLLLTGLTRDGVYLIEDGEIVGEVNNFRFNVSPLDLLRHAEAAGATERCLSREWSDFFTRAAMPPLLAAEFHMSSVSEAL